MKFIVVFWSHANREFWFDNVEPQVCLIIPERVKCSPGHQKVRSRDALYYIFYALKYFGELWKNITIFNFPKTILWITKGPWTLLP